MANSQSVYDMLANAQAGDLDEFMTLFAYEGFNPELVHAHMERIMEQKSIGREEFIQDMRALLTLGAMKGNYTLRNSGKISDAGRLRADELYKKYGMKVGGLDGDKKAIILPRVMSAFPELTTRVVLKAPDRDYGEYSRMLPKIIKNPVFPALIPKTLSSGAAQTLLYIYTIYSAEQSLAISQEKDFNAAFGVQGQFVTIAFNSSVPPEKTRIRIVKQVVDQLVDSVKAMEAITAGRAPIARVHHKEVERALVDLEIPAAVVKPPASSSTLQW